MGGEENIWENSQQISIQIWKKIADSFHKQLSNDREIEFITYNHDMDMDLERVTKGNGNKICQGSGPYYFTFKKILTKAQKKKLNKVYIILMGNFIIL